MAEGKVAHVAAVARGIESNDGVGRERPPRLVALNAWIGRWLNDGYTINEDGSRGGTITTSDVYEWAPGYRFVLHTAYGRISDIDVGGIEIIGFDEASGDFDSYFFDSQGNTTRSTLSVEGDTSTFAGANTRATVVMSESNHIQTVLFMNEPTTDRTTSRQ
jgi:hypothetical protein